MKWQHIWQNDVQGNRWEHQRVRNKRIKREGVQSPPTHLQ